MTAEEITQDYNIIWLAPDYCSDIMKIWADIQIEDLLKHHPTSNN